MNCERFFYYIYDADDDIGMRWYAADDLLYIYGHPAEHFGAQRRLDSRQKK